MGPSSDFDLARRAIPLPRNASLLSALWTPDDASPLKDRGKVWPPILRGPRMG